MLVTLFSARIIYGLHRINISLHTLGHFLAYLSKVAQELRLETLCHSECISINREPVRRSRHLHRFQSLQPSPSCLLQQQA